MQQVVNIVCPYKNPIYPAILAEKKGLKRSTLKLTKSKKGLVTLAVKIELGNICQRSTDYVFY